jgi:hypothetical protein
MRERATGHALRTRAALNDNISKLLHGVSRPRRKNAEGGDRFAMAPRNAGNQLLQAMQPAKVKRKEPESAPYVK